MKRPSTSILEGRAVQARRLPRRAALRDLSLLAAGVALLTACAPRGSSLPLAQPTPQSSTPALVPSLDTRPAPTAHPAGAPRPGGTLISTRTTDAPDLDPQLTPGLARQRVTMLTYNALLKLSPDMAIQPDLAETWKVSADGKQVDVTLRKGVMWHPPVRRELTADDVKFSYDRLLRELPGKADLAIVDSVDVLDKYSVRFTLSIPNAGILATMADPRWGAIVNRETVEAHGDLRTVAVGTGPFILDEWMPGQEMKLHRNPEYFEKGRPYVENLVLKVVPDEATTIAGLKTGAIHHAMLDDPRGYDQVKGPATLQTYRTPRLGYEFLSFNQANPPFNKPEVVQAINYAVDREECIKSAAAGFAVLTAPATPPMKQWQLSESQWQPFYKLSLEKARALLAQAGYPNGFETTCLTIANFSTMFANAQVIQANLKRIGITLRVESVDYPLWLQRWQRKDFELTLNTSTGFSDPDAAFYRAFHSGAQNWNNLSNPDLDRLLDDGRAVVEIEKRKAIYDKVQQILLERPGHLYLFSPEMVDVTQTSVQSFSQHPMSVLWSYQNVWLADQ